MSGPRTNLKVDPELRALIPPLTSEERAQLEANLVAEGCRDALVVWKGRGILLDGHHRHEICTRLGLDYRTIEIDLPDRDAAKAWIIRNQFGRRNLTPFQRAELALALEPLIAAKAKEHQRAGGGRGPSGRQKSAQPTKTRDEVAKAAGLSHDTIAKAKVVRDEADEETKAKLRRAETTIHREYRRIRPTKAKGPPRSSPSAATATQEYRYLMDSIERALSNKDPLTEMLRAFGQWGNKGGMANRIAGALDRLGQRAKRRAREVRSKATRVDQAGWVTDEADEQP
ncbi:MAG: hypothetical protein ACYTEZ_00205 [Planctomycetota bacterium]